MKASCHVHVSLFIKCPPLPHTLNFSKPASRSLSHVVTNIFTFMPLLGRIESQGANWFPQMLYRSAHLTVSVLNLHVFCTFVWIFTAWCQCPAAMATNLWTCLWKNNLLCILPLVENVLLLTWQTEINKSHQNLLCYISRKGEFLCLDAEMEQWSSLNFLQKWHQFFKLIMQNSGVHKWVPLPNYFKSSLWYFYLAVITISYASFYCTLSALKVWTNLFMKQFQNRPHKNLNFKIAHYKNTTLGCKKQQTSPECFDQGVMTLWIGSRTSDYCLLTVFTVCILKYWCFQESDCQVQPAPVALWAQYIVSEQDWPRSRYPQCCGLDCELQKKYFTGVAPECAGSNHTGYLVGFCWAEIKRVKKRIEEMYSRLYSTSQPGTNPPLVGYWAGFAALFVSVGVGCVWRSYLVWDKRVWRLLLCRRATLYRESTGKGCTQSVHFTVVRLVLFLCGSFFAVGWFHLWLLMVRKSFSGHRIGVQVILLVSASIEQL